MTNKKPEKQIKIEPYTRPNTSSLNTEERLTVLANLIIDKLLEKYSTSLESSAK